MSLFAKTKTRQLKIFFTIFIIVAVGWVVAIFMFNPSSDVVEPPLSNEGPGEADMTIDSFHTVSLRDGKKEWRLDADTVQYMEERQQAVLHKPTMTFFLKDGREAHLTAGRGILKTESNDLEVTGHVVIKFDKYRLETEKLHYEHQQRIIYTAAPVKISGDVFNLVADSVLVELNARKASFEGNIKGSIDGRALS